jgi:hypothetical protein
VTERNTFGNQHLLGTLLTALLMGMGICVPAEAQTAHWELDRSGWSAGAHTGTVVIDRQLTLLPGQDRGTFEVRLPGNTPFKSLLLSLNHEPWPAGSTVQTLVRVRVGEHWTDWFPVGDYGSAARFPRSARRAPELGVELKTDLVRAKRPARSAELRLVLTRGDAPPRVRRVAVDRWTRLAPIFTDTPKPSRAWGTALNVPQRSQRSEDAKIASRICSPTSLGMVMAFWGRSLDTPRVASGVYDKAAELYGNWSFNVAFASTHGLRATASHLDGLQDVEREIAAGRPVVISHRYGKGELKASPISETEGHLIVVVGFTKTGDVIVNDPAANPARGQKIRRVYDRAEFLKTWQGNAEGVAYLLSPLKN